MKIRHGFVSNSSSSSFAVMLPENFDPRSYDYTKLPEYQQYGPTQWTPDRVAPTNDQVADEMEKLIKAGSMWYEQLEYPYLLSEALTDVGLIVASFEGGPDMSQMAIVDRDEIREFMLTGEKPKAKEPLSDDDIQKVIQDNGGVSAIIVDGFMNR